MKNLNQIELGVVDYIENEILANSTPINKFVLGTAVGIARPKFETMFLQYANNPVVKSLGVVDKNNMVDLDVLYNASKESIRKSGKVEFMGILFDESDIDKLYTFINNR